MRLGDILGRSWCVVVGGGGCGMGDGGGGMGREVNEGASGKERVSERGRVERKPDDMLVRN